MTRLSLIGYKAIAQVMAFHIPGCSIYWFSILCGSRCADASNTVTEVFPNVNVLIGQQVAGTVDAVGQSVSIGFAATYPEVK